MNIETGQAIIKHEPNDDSSVSITHPKVRAEMNRHLGIELNDIILSPVVGIQKIRKVLNLFGIDIPALYELDFNGDEAIIEMDQFGKVFDAFNIVKPNIDRPENILVYLYFIYYLTDSGVYSFHAEIADKERIDEILMEDEELTDDDV